MEGFPTSAATATVRNAEASTDSELVAEVRRGDPRAFEVLYERYHRRISAYVNGMVGDHGRAEELTQDVFLSALRRMGDTERPIAFKPWIYEIAKNACIDQFRRSRRAEVVSIDADEGLGAADYGRLVSKNASPDAALDRKQSLDDLLGAFDGLNRTHHRILVMRELEGLTYREIGERLGMSRAAVESTLFRARRRLGEEYQELATGERCMRVHGLIADATVRAPAARDRRRLSAHLSHCQPCRRHAAVAGLEVAALAPRGARAKIAGLIPLPGFLWQRWSGETGTPGVGGAPGAVLAQVTTQAAPVFGAGGAGWGRAAAAAAALAVAAVAGEQVVAGHGATVHQDRTSSRNGSVTRPVRSASTPTPGSPQGAATAAAQTAPTPARRERTGPAGARASSAGVSKTADRGGFSTAPATQTAAAPAAPSGGGAPKSGVGSVPATATSTTTSTVASAPAVPSTPSTTSLAGSATPTPAPQPVAAALAPVTPVITGAVDSVAAALGQGANAQRQTPGPVVTTATDAVAAAAHAAESVAGSVVPHG